MHKKVMPRYATCDIPNQKKIPLTVVVDEEGIGGKGSLGRRAGFKTPV